MPAPPAAPPRPLFRPEASAGVPAFLEIGGGSWSWVTGLLAALAAAALLFLATVDVARKETAYGHLARGAGTYRAAPPRPGILAELFVAQGDAVSAGDPLFAVAFPRYPGADTDLSDGLRASLRRQRQLVQEQLAAAERQAGAEERRLAARIAGAEGERTALAAQRTLQAERADVTRRRLDALAALRAKGYVSEADYRAQEDAWLAQRLGTAALDQRIAALDAELGEARTQRESLPAASAATLAELRIRLAEIDRQDLHAAADGALVVRAPAAGRVEGIQAAPGHPVEPGRPVLSVVPWADALHAELFVSTAAIGLVRPGQRVALAYDAFPFRRFGLQEGEVESVSGVLVAPDEVAGPHRPAAPGHRVRVRLARQTVDDRGTAVPLQPDMRLRAEIVLEERPLLRRLLDPLAPAAGR